MKAALLQHLPEVLSPTLLEESIEPQPKTLPEELHLPDVQLVEPTKDQMRSPETPKLSESLIKCYPTQLDEACVQTVPKDSIPDCGEDFYAGQPVDGIQALAPSKPKVAPLKFVKSQPKPTMTVEEGEDGEYSSFLPDFRRAGDPLRKEAPATSDSNTSSEWEFLDN